MTYRQIIDDLLEKSANPRIDAAEAMKFTQAALNAANAISTFYAIPVQIRDR